MYPDIQTKSYALDLTSISTMAEYRMHVKKAGLESLDIGILCLNAGLNHPGLVDLVDDKEFESIWNINALHVVYLLKALSNQLLRRDKRCAVLITSSISCYLIRPGSASYAATKMMISNFGEAVHYELKANVDVTVWEPGYISTTMIHTANPPSCLLVPTTKAVADVLTLLGKERRTTGSFKFDMYPTWLT